MSAFRTSPSRAAKSSPAPWWDAPALALAGILVMGQAANACAIEHATYRPVQDDPGDTAMLQFRPAPDMLMGVAATLTTPEGPQLDAQFSSSNGYVQIYTTMTRGVVEVESIVKAFTAEMTNAALGVGDPAPAFIIFPEAGLAADLAHRGKDVVAFTVPDAAWRFAGCK